MDGIGQKTEIIILRLTSGRIFDGFFYRPLNERIRTPDDKNYHLMDGGGRVDGRTDETDGLGLGKFEVRVEGEF